MHLRDGANSQYVTGTAFLFSVYSDILARHKQQVICGNKKFDSTRVMAFAKQQVKFKHATFSSEILAIHACLSSDDHVLNGSADGLSTRKEPKRKIVHGRIR